MPSSFSLGGQRPSLGQRVAFEGEHPVARFNLVLTDVRAVGIVDAVIYVANDGDDAVVCSQQGGCAWPKEFGYRRKVARHGVKKTGREICRRLGRCEWLDIKFIVGQDVFL